MHWGRQYLVKRFQPLLVLWRITWRKWRNSGNVLHTYVDIREETPGQ